MFMLILIAFVTGFCLTLAACNLIAPRSCRAAAICLERLIRREWRLTLATAGAVANNLAATVITATDSRNHFPRPAVATYPVATICPPLPCPALDRLQRALDHLPLARRAIGTLTVNTLSDDVTLALVSLGYAPLCDTIDDGYDVTIWSGRAAGRNGRLRVATRRGYHVITMA